MLVNVLSLLQPFPAQGERHRGRVTLVAAGAAESGAALFHVRLIDFGVEHQCGLGDLWLYGRTGAAAQYADVPPRAFECRLAELQPSQLTAERGQWTADAVEAFRAMVMGGGDDGGAALVRLQVYSVVERCAHVVAWAGAGTAANVNEFLVAEGQAQVCDESYASKADHIRRVERQQMPFDDPQTDAIDEQLLQQMAECPAGDDDEFGDDDDEDAAAARGPRPTQCYINVPLSGPHSPLESRVYGVAGGAEHRQVNVEPHSVNSVLLEDRSQVGPITLIRVLRCLVKKLYEHAYRTNWEF